MKIVIVGCGRMGGSLARTLHLKGHQVTVIDKDPLAFERLGPAFGGRTVVGIGFDRDALTQAGIERTDALAAVTTSDETNVVTARIARLTFHVPRVVARVYDPRKADIYRRLGLQTVSPVVLATSRLAELVSFSHLDTVASLGNGEVEIVLAEIPPMFAGRMAKDLAAVGEIQVIAITRSGKTFLPAPTATFEEGDAVHLAVLSTAMDRLQAWMA
jgi:trk system potassium uptake protein TrkA